MEHRPAPLLQAFLEIVAPWRAVFPQTRSYLRALRQALAGLICLGRRTVSRLIWTNGGQQRSWSAEYFLHSRCRWEPQQLFATIWQNALPYCRGPYVGVAVDDTRLHKTGRRIRQAFFQRDPLSPPFHCNLMLGLRFLQASLLVPLHRRHRGSTRALPVRFQEASAVKRPKRNAPAEQWQQYRVAVKLHNLSRSFVTMMSQLRQALETAGGHLKTLVLAVDGSFCNRTVFTAVVRGVELIARARSDARLCFRAPEGSRRFYSPHKFTPEQIRQDKTIPWKIAFLFYGGKRRLVRYKELLGVYWQGGARKRRLRLLVVAPTPYRKRKSERLYYRRPAFLLTTVLEGLAGPLLQIYFDRWQIEVNHREEKDTLGVGQAQLRNVISVPKQPVLMVAAYSALLLASLKAFGAARGPEYALLPRWRKHASRPSCLDLITLLRKEMAEAPELVAQLALNPSYQSLTSAAAA
jgi:hypothetical protein